MIRVEPGDCLEVMAQLAQEGVAVDSIITDPPYHLTSIVKRFGKPGSAPVKAGKTGAYKRHSTGFMGKTWDGGDVAFDPKTWRLCFDLLKPGGHMLVFGGTRTYHRMVCAVEDAGFEVRDKINFEYWSGRDWQAFLDSLNGEQVAALTNCIERAPGYLQWLYGSGFPKSHDVSKAIDKAARGVPHGGPDPTSPHHGKYKGGCSDENPRGQGFGAGPGQFMREQSDGDSRELVAEAQEWQGWGTALKPACEPILVARKPLAEGSVAANVLRHGAGAINVDGCRVDTNEDCRRTMHTDSRFFAKAGGETGGHEAGRWPANVIHDGSEEVLDAFAQFGVAGGGYGKRGGGGSVYAEQASFRGDMREVGFGDSGTAARFFYTAKADKTDHLGSKHPTVKPVDLIAYLCRLITPPGGLVLDPFAGSGTTASACLREGFDCILIEKEAEYVADIKRRLKHVEGADTPLFRDGAA